MKSRLNSSAPPIVGKTEAAPVKAEVAQEAVAQAMAADVIAQRQHEQIITQQAQMIGQFIDASKLPSVFVNMFMLNDAGPNNLRLTFGDQFNAQVPPVMRAQLMFDISMFKQMSTNFAKLVEQIEAAEEKQKKASEKVSVRDQERDIGEFG